MQLDIARTNIKNISDTSPPITPSLHMHVTISTTNVNMDP